MASPSKLKMKIPAVYVAKMHIPMFCCCTRQQMFYLGFKEQRNSSLITLIKLVMPSIGFNCGRCTSGAKIEQWDGSGELKPWGLNWKWVAGCSHKSSNKFSQKDTKKLMKNYFNVRIPEIYQVWNLFVLQTEKCFISYINKSIVLSSVQLTVYTVTIIVANN